MPYLIQKVDLFETENTAFSTTTSDDALGEGYDKSYPSSRSKVVVLEAARNVLDGRFSSLLSMFALLSVTGMDITSVYLETIGKETKYSKFLNDLTNSRTKRSLFKSKLVNHSPKLIFLWSRSGISSLQGLDTTFLPNYFVPLISFQLSHITVGNGRSKAPKEQLKISDIFMKGTSGEMSSKLISNSKPQHTESNATNLLEPDPVSSLSLNTPDKQDKVVFHSPSTAADVEENGIL